MKESQLTFSRRLNKQCMCARQRIRVHVFSVVFLILYVGAEVGESAMYANCDETVSSSSGEIQSPNYPGLYPNNAACKWRFNLESYQMLTLSFKEFSLEGRGSCISGDKLEISSRSSAASLLIPPRRLTYCGSSLPPPYISDESMDRVSITFTSDKTQFGTGFNIEYIIGQRYLEQCNQDTEFHCRVGNCIPLRWHCNGVSECSDGSDELPQFCQVSTPRYTSAPRASSASSASSEPVQCPAHFFSCQTVSTNSHACLPESMKCNGHVDCTDQLDEYNCKCMHHLKGTWGYFKSPNFPNQYDANLNCTWYLEINKGSVIQLRFDVFDLEQQYHTDYVTVYDVDDNDKLNKIGTFYGYMKDRKKSVYMPPTVIDGNGNQLKVVFYTDGEVSGMGFNATYQTKGSCLEGQQLCSPTDANCFDEKERCDNHMTCLEGQDEMGCSASCGPDHIPCYRSSKGCFTLDKRCNGKNDCLAGEDEKYCSTELCNSNRGLFCCKDGTCIEEKYTCDSSPDCRHAEDEENCIVTTNIVTAAAVGSIICGLLLVAALSCTCKLYQLRIRERLPPSHVSPLREIEEELLRREAPPSYTATMASPHFDEAQRAFIEGIQAAMIARNESRSAERNGSGRGRRSQRGTLVRMLSRDRNTRSAEHSQVEADEHSRESQTETLPPNPEAAEGIDDTSTATPEGEIDMNVDPPPIRRFSGEHSAPIECSGSAEASPESAIRGQQDDSTSSSVSDTDSETNVDALQLDPRDQQILRATANIRRMRLVGGLQNILQAQDHIAARSHRRTDSLGDTEGTDSVSNADLNTQPAAAVMSPNNNVNNNSDQDSTSKQVTTDEPIESSKNLPPHQDPNPQLHPPTETPQREQTPPPSDVDIQSQNGQTTCDNEESEIRKTDSEQDLGQLSQASSLLSVVSTDSQKTGEDCEMLKL